LLRYSTICPWLFLCPPVFPSIHRTIHPYPVASSRSAVATPLIYNDMPTHICT
jgi:hypothetical protein